MNWPYLAVVAGGLILFGRWLRHPDSRARRMTGGPGPSPRHPAYRPSRAAVKAGQDAAFAEITAELAAEMDGRYEAIARAYTDLGPPPGWDDIRRMIPEQATDYEGDK